MKRGWLRACAFLSLAIQLNGCAAVLLSAGAAGGYAISRDSISNRFDKAQNELLTTSREALREMGFVTNEDPSHGWIKATVDGANVTVNVKRVSETSVELRVRARNKFLMPRIGVAQAVYNKIVGRL